MPKSSNIKTRKQPERAVKKKSTNTPSLKSKSPKKKSTSALERENKKLKEKIKKLKQLIGDSKVDSEATQSLEEQNNVEKKEEESEISVEHPTSETEEDQRSQDPETQQQTDDTEEEHVEETEEADTEADLTIGDVTLPANRREEIKKFLELFGYTPEHSIIQVYDASNFSYKGKVVPEYEKTHREKARERYGGSAFVIVGRTHDPAIKEKLAPPVGKLATYKKSYLGYISKKRLGKSPHKIIPLDFTPTNFKYPKEWREVYPSKSGFLLAMHTPLEFASRKNELMRVLYKEGKEHDITENWTWLDDVTKYGSE